MGDWKVLEYLLAKSQTKVTSLWAKARQVAGWEVFTSLHASQRFAIEFLFTLALITCFQWFA